MKEFMGLSLDSGFRVTRNSQAGPFIQEVRAGFTKVQVVPEDWMAAFNKKLKAISPLPDLHRLDLILHTFI